MQKQEKILFIYTNLSAFVKTDLETLQSNFAVTTFQFKLNKPYQIIISYFKQFFTLLFTTWRYKKIFIWFGDYHSFLPILFAQIMHKKTFLVIGGYDVCRIKKFGYGSFKNPIRGYMTRYSMNHCTLNLCVSKNVERKVKAIAPKANTIILYNGVNFKPYETPTKKQNTVLTVGKLNSAKRVRLKGIDLFVEAARNLPEITFTIIGGTIPLITSVCGPLPPNLKIYPFMKQEELMQHYQKAKVYCQFSVTESFCLTLAEAMFYNCVPIITNVGGMMEVTGKEGYCVKNNINDITQKIKTAIQQPYSEIYNQRITNYFMLSQRATALLNIMSE